MIKDYIFTEAISGFNEDLVIANKPNALLKAKNADFETQPGTLRKRKGFAILGERITTGKKILGLFNFVDSTKKNIPLAVIDLPSSVNSKQLWLSSDISGLSLTTEEGDQFITEDGYNLIT